MNGSLDWKTVGFLSPNRFCKAWSASVIFPREGWWTHTRVGSDGLLPVFTLTPNLSFDRLRALVLTCFAVYLLLYVNHDIIPMTEQGEGESPLPPFVFRPSRDRVKKTFFRASSPSPPSLTRFFLTVPLVVCYFWLKWGLFRRGRGGAYSVAAVVMQIFPFLLLFISSSKNMGIWRQMNFAELATLECFLHFDKKKTCFTEAR